MQHTLSRNQMFQYIVWLKNALLIYNRQICNNLIFFDEYSYYQHICAFRLPCTEKDNENRLFGKRRDSVPKNVGELLDILEPYIPFTLTEENYCLFMRAVEQSLNSDETTATDVFIQKAKMDFVISLRETCEQTEWEHLLYICDTLRALKETPLTVYN